MPVRNLITIGCVLTITFSEQSEQEEQQQVTGSSNRACQVLVYVLFDRGRFGTSSTVVAAVRLLSLRSFFIAFDFNSLKI